MLCRCLGVVHPDYLLERLTAAQLWEWWVLWNDEPWGDLRDDLRSGAHAMLQAGGDVRVSWPYVDGPMTADEIQGVIDDVNEAENGNRCENLHRD